MCILIYLYSIIKKNNAALQSKALKGKFAYNQDKVCTNRADKMTAGININCASSFKPSINIIFWPLFFSLRNNKSLIANRLIKT